MRAWCLAAAIVLVPAFAAGGAAQVRQDGQGAAPAPAGKIAYFLRGGGAVYLAVTDFGAADTRLWRVPNQAAKRGPEGLEFSRDGMSVSFFARKSSLFVVDARGLRLSRAYSARQLGPGAIDVSVSSAGGRIAVAHKLYPNSCSGRTWISVVERNGSSRNVQALPPVARATPERSASIEAVVWSPDGRSLTYPVARFDDPSNCRRNEFGRGFIFRTNASGRGKIVTLRSSRDWVGEPQWSPTGAHVAFTEGFERQDVFVTGANGSRTQRVTRLANAETLSYRWSAPNSIVVAVERWDADFNESATLYTTGLDPSAQRRITDFPTMGFVLAATPEFAVVATSEHELATVSLSDGQVVRRTSLTSPRPGLARGEFDYQIAVWLKR